MVQKEEDGASAFICLQTTTPHLTDHIPLRFQGSGATNRHPGHRRPSVPSLLLLRDSNRPRQRSDRPYHLADQERHAAHSGRPHALLLVVCRAVQLVDHHGVGLGSELDHDRRALVRRPLSTLLPQSYISLTLSRATLLALQPSHFGRRRSRLSARYILSLLAVAQDALARRLGPRQRRFHNARVRARSVVVLAFGRSWFRRWQSGCVPCPFLLRLQPSQ